MSARSCPTPACCSRWSSGDGCRLSQWRLFERQPSRQTAAIGAVNGLAREQHPTQVGGLAGVLQVVGEHTDQPHAERGTRACARSVRKKASIASLVLLSCSPVMSYLLNEPLWFSFATAVSFSVIVWLVMVFGSWSDFMSFSQQMNAVGAALGMPEPKNMDLFKSTKQAKANGKPDLPMGVYYY